MKAGFLIDGHKVTWDKGLAEFHKYGILIKIPVKEFSLNWAVCMNYKLSILVGQHLVRPVDMRDPVASKGNE